MTFNTGPWPSGISKVKFAAVGITTSEHWSPKVSGGFWLWWSGTGASETDVDRLWHAFLRRFDLEHTFRMIKQTLGWTRPKLRDPEAAGRRTWLIVAAHTQLRLVRGLVTDLQRP